MAHIPELLRQAPLIAVSATTFVICGGIVASLHFPLANPIDTLANGGLYLLSLIFMVIADIGIALHRHRPARPIAFLGRRYCDPDLVCGLLVRIPIFMIVILLTTIFGQMKSLIPAIHPFTWDATFIAADRAIFGTDAWLALQPLIGYPIVTSALSVLYHAWILLLYPGTLFFLLHRSSDQIRHRYFLSFVLIWSVIGIGMATMLASVGPCFLEPITGDAHFAGLIAYLKSANEQYPVMVLYVQDLLLKSYHNSKLGLGMGISAMPSMHVAMAFLYYLAIRHVSRRAGWFFLIFTIVIWIASVHLAYHYAVDGLVAVIATAILWVASKQILAWWDKTLPALGAAQAARVQAV